MREFACVRVVVVFDSLKLRSEVEDEVPHEKIRSARPYSGPKSDP